MRGDGRGGGGSGGRGGGGGGGRGGRRWCWWRVDDGEVRRNFKVGLTN